MKHAAVRAVGWRRLAGFGAILGVLALWAGGFSCGGDTQTGGPAGTSATGGAAGHGGSGEGGAGGHGGGQVGCFAGLTSIALSPADSTVPLDGVSAPPIPFDATGTFEDGSVVLLEPSKLAWSATRDDETPPGTIADGVLTPYALAGGVVTIAATDTCVTGSTTVKLLLDVTLGAPSDPVAWAGAPVTGAPAPDLVYPSDQTRFPRNIYRTLFQWRSQGFSDFRLNFEGPNASVTVYTDGVHGLCANANPEAGCWEVDEVAWGYIAGSNAGTTATWTVDALDPSTTPATVRRSGTITLGFSKQDVKGAIFYWSTTSAGVRRGKISKQTPEDYIVGKPGTTYGTDQVKCVACHVVSRDGKYMAAPVQSTSGDSLWILEVTPAPPPTPLVTSVENTKGHGFATISPDDALVVAAWKGKMWTVDRATGAFVEDLPLGGLEGTHPDWSPLGTEVVFATGNGDSPGDAALAKIPFAGGVWGQPTTLLAPPAGLSNLFPMFSPDGAWVAFAQGNGGHGDDTAQLMVIQGSGGQPIELVQANRVTSNVLTDGQYQNSQPTWAPHGDYDWVAFNTKREYGVVSGGGTQQIWVAAVDLTKAEQGLDPSYPAFRMPFQGLDENNHRAFWTLDINEGSGGGGGTGGQGAGGTPCADILTLGEACDPLTDCCEAGTLCDTNDNGATYVCDAPG